MPDDDYTLPCEPLKSHEILNDKIMFMLCSGTGYSAAFTVSVCKKTSLKHLRTKVTPDYHLTYSKNGGNLGSE